MIERKQLFRHDPENAQFGDCWRTAIACLLDLEPGDVPHFAVGNATEDEWYERTLAWLKPWGLCLVAYPMGAEWSRDQVIESVSHHNRGVHWILSGRNGNGANHNIICRDGAMVWDSSLDPHELGVTEAATGGHWWIYFIGVLV